MPAAIINMIITESMYALLKWAMDVFFVEKPPVGSVVKVWHRASNRLIPPSAKRIVSPTLINA